jgi:hypothetical protein
MNRRSFLKGLSIALAGSALLGAPSLASASESWFVTENIRSQSEIEAQLEALIRNLRASTVKVWEERLLSEYAALATPL